MTIRRFKSTAFSPLSPGRIRPSGYTYSSFPIDLFSIVEPGTCPGIASNPVNANGSVGSSASFSVSVTSETGVTFQWQYSTNSGVSWSDLAESSPYIGTQTDTLTIDPVMLAQNGYFYRCIIRHSGCFDVFSNQGILTATCPVIAITSQPTESSIHAGESTSFSVSATPASATFQWQVSINSGASWSDIANGGVYSGATTDALALASVPIGYDGYMYRVVVSIGDCPSSETSDEVGLVVEAVPSVALVCDSETGTATLCGVSEYTSPSTPPKKYRTQTIAGDAYLCRFWTGVTCAPPNAERQLVYAVYSGSYEYNALTCAEVNGQIVSECTKPDGTGCSPLCTPILVGTVGLIFSPDILTGRGLPPPVPTITATNKTWFKAACESGDIKNMAVTSNLSNEDTEDQAIVRASKTPGSSCTAYREPRGAGDFSLLFANVAFDINCSGLITGKSYIVHYSLTTENYGGGSPVVTNHTVPFVATGPTETVGDALVCDSGKQVTVGSASISY